MGQWLSWVKSNEKQLLEILDNLAIKAVETSEALVVLFSDLKYILYICLCYFCEVERCFTFEIERTFCFFEDIEEGAD